MTTTIAYEAQNTGDTPVYVTLLPEGDPAHYQFLRLLDTTAMGSLSISSDTTHLTLAAIASEQSTKLDASAISLYGYLEDALDSVAERSEVDAVSGQSVQDFLPDLTNLAALASTQTTGGVPVLNIPLSPLGEPMIARPIEQTSNGVRLRAYMVGSRLRIQADDLNGEQKKAQIRKPAWPIITALALMGCAAVGLIVYVILSHTGFITSCGGNRHVQRAIGIHGGGELHLS